MTDVAAETTAATLTAAVLDQEAERLAVQAHAADARVLADDELPGVRTRSLADGSFLHTAGD